MQEKNSKNTFEGYESFGERLERLLKEREYSRKGFADSMGVHINTVGHWIRNEKTPHLNVIRQIAAHLKVSYNYLVTGETPADYAAREHRSALQFGDVKAIYSNLGNDEARKILKKFNRLDESSRKLVLGMIDKILGEEDED